MTDEKNKNSGGMYRGINVPTKLLDFVITTGILLILAVVMFGMIK